MVFRDKVRMPFLAFRFISPSVALSLSTIPITFALFAIFSIARFAAVTDFSTFPLPPRETKQTSGYSPLKMFL